MRRGLGIDCRHRRAAVDSRGPGGRDIYAEKTGENDREHAGEGAHQDALVWVLSIFGVLLNIFGISEHLRRCSFFPKVLTSPTGHLVSTFGAARARQVWL
jgi:hypothetical protein